MNKLFTILVSFLSILFSPSLGRAGVEGQVGTPVVGGDLSMLPAYEQAGDKWLDESGNEIGDLLCYLHQECGWTAVRVRLFVDPARDAYLGTCQDLDYVKALGRRVKDEGMALLVDFHYSDTWADPSRQQIPASWTDHTTQGLCRSLYDYTYDATRSLIEAGARPDYVQIGNEISYGLLWNTSNGSYPSSNSQYEQAGYCPSWEDSYTLPGAWQRTAALLGNGAQAVHRAFDDMGLDSTSVRLIVHTALSNMEWTKDNFYRHIERAGFTNYDIIGLSYYPFDHGSLSALSTLLTTVERDFPQRPVHIVETAYYGESYWHQDNYDFSQLWPFTPKGQQQYLTDLIAELHKHSQVEGLYYWLPEECGTGYATKVWDHVLARSFWQTGAQQRHPMLLPPEGEAPIKTLCTFLGSEDAITALPVHPSGESPLYTLSGTRAYTPRPGIYIKNGRKVVM